MLLSHLVRVSLRVASTRSRLAKRAVLSECLREAAPDEVGLVVSYLCGTLPQGRIGLGPAILRTLAAGTGGHESCLTLHELDDTFQIIAETQGKGSQHARRVRLGALFARTSTEERDFLVRLILGEVRHGALEGILVETVADAARLPADQVRRAVMLAGDAASVASAALTEGQAGLARFRLQPLSPVQPMLAQPAQDMDEAITLLGEAALEYKLDGARVQIHKDDNEVRIFSRRLHDVTARLPEVVDAVLGLPSRRLILDGEVVALHNGRPLPFQVTMRRFGRKSDVDRMRRTLPLNVFLFDCLYRDDDTLIDRAARERFASLADGVPTELLVPRTVSDRVDVATAFLAQALERGHEGIMAKSLASHYAAGRRGADWLKVKQAHTLDLIVLAAEWGSGRRRGWLSNLHLGARDPRDGSVVMLGKTFKGLTDKLLEWQTKRLLELEVARSERVVHVRPELVAEIAVNEIQQSPQYPAGMALRFARVKRYRHDKGPAEADTIDTVRQLYARQGGGAP